MMITKRPCQPRMNARAYALFLKSLVETPQSSTDLIESTGIGGSAVRNYIRELRWAKLIYIYDYTVDVNWRTRAEIWAWGPGMPDAPRPKKKSMNERCRDYRRRQREKKKQALLSGLTSA